ncbi:MAG: glycosyltransferase [Candidatus Omnitrophica bacterium]|nr:glycosyltransferase [Candidatus Omnitrophota bacterium]
MFPYISIIVATKKNNRFLEECIQNCLRLDYPFFEVIVLPDENITINSDPRIKIIPTGSVLPAAKRDIGATEAQGQVLAFLDDDAYPNSDWLKQSALDFQDKDIACVCGPAITPKNDPLLNKASGKIYESFIVSGPARFRYVSLKRRFTDDFPSCNFLIRKNIFQQLGGFNTKFWPGEDTILCLEVVHKLEKKILYDPLVLVHHYRRPLFRKHLHQVSNYARHRGYFLKRYPKTSLKLGYFGHTFIMLMFFISLLFGIFLDPKFFYILLSYSLMVFVFSIQRNIKLTFLVFIGTILTHLTYGLNFIVGLLSWRLKEE